VTRLVDAPGAVIVRDRGREPKVAARRRTKSPPDRSPETRSLSEGKAALIDALLLLLLAGSVVAVAANLVRVRPELVIAAATFVPGWALMSRLPATDLLTSAALATALSMAAEIAGTLVIGWTHWWHPEVLGAIIAGASAVLLTVRIGSVLRRRSMRVQLRWSAISLRAFALGTVLPLVPFAVAMSLWGLSLGQIDVASLGRDGLAAALPPIWFAALGTLIAGGVCACWGWRCSGTVMAAYVLGAVVVLFATVPAVADVPRYSWVYKHIGVTGFIQANHGPDPSGDIYNRFPGFFTLAAAASKWMGIGPLAFAGWGEPFFALLSSLLVGALTRTVKRDLRVAAFAALLFTLADWPGQTYFSPQAASFVLALAVILIALRGLPPGQTLSKLPATLSKLRALARDAKPSPLWSTRASTAAIVALDAIAVPTHQLTPYILLLQFGLLIVIGAVRGRWQFLVMAVITVGYTIANFSYLNHNYGLLTSLDPLSNLQVAGGFGATAHAGIPEAHGGAFVGVVLVILALCAAWRIARVGGGSRIVVPLLLVAAPVGILVGQRYGGEATIRAYLFSLPWQAALIAAGVLTVRRRLVRTAGAAVICLVVTAGFIPAFYGADGLNIFPSDEVAASAYLYSHAPSGSVLVLAAPDFPTNVNFRYPLIDDSKPPLVTTPQFGHRELGSADVPAVASAILRNGTSDFLVFATSESRAARWAELAPAGALQRLEGAVASSPDFRLWYRNPDVRIYELVSGELPQGAPAALATPSGLSPPALPTTPAFTPQPPDSLRGAPAPTHHVVNHRPTRARVRH
jgi:hypothetical protein